MKNDPCTKFITESFFGTAYHKIILDESGKPVDYVFLEVNKSFEELTGMTAKDILNKRVTEVIPGIIKSAFDWIGFYGKIARGGGSHEFEQYSEPLKRWYKVYAYSTEKDYFATIFTDVTRDKLAHEELERFFSTNLDLLCIADVDGKFVKVNKSWADMLGYTSTELETKEFLSFVHPDDMQATLEALMDLKAAKDILNFTNRYRTKDGSYRHIEWRSRPYGHLIYSSARDITDRLESETKLRETEKRLSAAQSFASVGAWEYNINDGRLYWSKECEALFGLEEGEFEGSFEGFLKRVHPDDRQLVIETNQPITNYREAIPLEYEHRIIKKNGEVCWVRESAGLMLDDTGKEKKIVGFMMDITKRRLAEDELSRSEKRYRGLIESQSDLIVRVDPENRFTFVNDAYCRMFGKSRDELIGHYFTPLVHEDDIQLTLDAMKDLYKPPYRCSVTQRAMTKYGWHWLQWENNAILDGDGNIQEIQGVGRDITNLKNAEELLKASEAQMKSILAETPAVVYSYRLLNGIPDITYISENVVNILGFKPDHFLHNFEAWAACVHPEDLEQNQQRFVIHEKQICEGEEVSFEYRFKDHNGNFHWLSDRQRALKDVDGNIKFVGVWIDITQRMKDQEAIENEEKLRQIIENLDGVFWLRSADKKEMLYVSDAYEQIFGRSKQSLKDYPASFMGKIHQDDKGRIEAAFSHFLITGKFNQDYRITKPDGKMAWLSSKAFPVKNADGRIIRYAGIVTDITEKEIIKEQLILAKEKAEESDRMKSGFLATISHELRTPLNHILGYSDIIRSSSKDDDHHKFAGIIYESGRKFLSMLEDLLILALIDRGEIKLLKKSHQITELFLENKSSLEEILAESGKNEQIRLVFKPDSRLLKSYIHIDIYKISLVLVNLFRNAVKFTEEGTIEYGFYEQDKNMLVLYVKDTGVGIPADKFNIILDFFRQVDDSHTRHFEGLGIGLAIAQRIAHAMHGYLSVSSVEGKGSTFYFSIPLELVGKVKEVANPAVTIENYDFSGKTILIAEDDKLELAMIGSLLKSSRVNILEAVNGEEAVEIFNKHPEIEMVLMDLKMPVLDGYEATRHIKSVKPELPVMALTANYQEKDKAMGAGCDEVITKPVEPDLLLCYLAKYLRKNNSKSYL